MNGSSPSPSPGPSDQPSERLLDSWKAIANYVKRDVSTVQRWEKREGMPVHRHLHDKRGSVYALPAELDAWLQTRSLQFEDDREGANTEVAEKAPRIFPTGRWFFLGGVAVLALLAIVYLAARKQTSGPTTGRILSVAVLPLTNLSGDPSQQYLADGMTEELIGRLAGIRNLRVISRTSVMRFKDSKLSVPEIAKMLNVDAIVEGSVIRDGSRVRVHAQLIQAAIDAHIWAESYDREMEDALGLESELAQAIAAKVEVTVTGEERTRLAATRNVSPEVYENYLKGQFSKNNNREEVEKSVAYFERAIQQDPTFAPAYVELAEAYDTLGTIFVGAPPDLSRQKVIDAAQKALALDAGLARAHSLVADIYQKRWRWAEAEVEYKRALELEPNDATAHVRYAEWLLCQGRTTEALQWAQRARELDPLGDYGTKIGWIYFHRREYDNAIRELRSVLAVNPNDAGALWFLGFVLTAKGQPHEAIAPLEKAVSASHRSPGVIALLIRAYAQSGRRPEALRLLAEMKQRRQSGYVPAGAFINAYLGLGDKEEAFVWLEQAYKEQSNILQYLKVHPFFDPLRNDPRFKDLMHRVGLS